MQILVPSVAPTINEGKSINHSSIFLTWNLTSGWDGKPVGFLIRWGTEQVTVNRTSYVITGLQGVTMYTISISGTTNVGAGEPAYINVTTLIGRKFIYSFLNTTLVQPMAGI